MIKRVDFFKKDFKLETKLYCEKCKDITDHTIAVLKDCPEDGGVPTLITCHDCLNAYVKLDELGIKQEPCVLFKRFKTLSWVFIVLHKHYLD